MSIFESKSQIFWRKLREGLGRFFGKTGAWFSKMSAEFKELPKAARTTVLTGASMLLVLIAFSIFIWPMLQRPEPAPEEPAHETVAEAIERIDSNTQGHVTPDMVPDLITDIEEQVERSDNDREIARLYKMKFKVLFNAGQFHNAVIAGNEAVDRDLLEGPEKFEMYAGLVFAYDQIGDIAQRRRFAELALAEFDNGTIEDFGSRQYYEAIVLGLFDK
jgi:hypothetical protein